MQPLLIENQGWGCNHQKYNNKIFKQIILDYHLCQSNKYFFHLNVIQLDHVINRNNLFKVYTGHIIKKSICAT